MILLVRQKRSWLRRRAAEPSMAGRARRPRLGAALESALVPRVKDLNLARIENTRGATVRAAGSSSDVPRARARDPNSQPPKPSPSFRAKDGENNLVRESEFPIKQSRREIKCTRPNSRPFKIVVGRSRRKRRRKVRVRERFGLPRAIIRGVRVLSRERLDFFLRPY